MSQSAEKKLRNLAAQNTQLISDLTWPNVAGFPLFMWFDRQLAQGDIGKPSDGKVCVYAHRVSSARPANNQGGVTALSLPRIQIDIVCYVAETARLVGQHMVAFMNSISLCNPGNYTSPVTAPNQNPNFLLNEREGIMPQLNPTPFVWTQDWRIYNNENIP